MKPKHNVVFCNASQKSKMLFESKAKADNFIKFNGEAILEEAGKAPVRSYYCQMCGGYHLTSNKSKGLGERLDNRDEQVIHRIHCSEIIKRDILPSIAIESNEKIKKISGKLGSAYSHILSGQIKEAEYLLAICEDDMASIKTNVKGIGRRLEKLYATLREYQSVVNHINTLDELDEEEQADYLKKLDSSDVEIVANSLANIKYLRSFYSLINEIDIDLQKGNIAEAKQIIEECKDFRTKLIGKATHVTHVMKKEYELRETRLKEIETLSSSNNAGNLSYNAQRIEDSEHKAVILEIIEKLELLNEAYGRQDYDECENLLDIASSIYATFTHDDDKTALLYEQIHFWEEKINNL